MIRGFITVSMVLALPAVGAPVDSSDLARCHAMATRDQQLDCYEALAAAAASGATTAHVAPTAPAVASAPAGPGAPTAAAVASTPAGSAAPSAPGEQPAAPFNPDDPANFGLSRRQADPHPSAPSTPTALKSTVFQMTEDRLHNVTVLLDNGQTWKFIDPEPRLRPGDAVTIKRASLGSFLMLTPSRRSYRVERSK